MITRDVVTLSLNVALHEDYVPTSTFGVQNKNEMVMVYHPSHPT